MTNKNKPERTPKKASQANKSMEKSTAKVSKPRGRPKKSIVNVGDKTRKKIKSNEGVAPTKDVTSALKKGTRRGRKPKVEAESLVEKKVREIVKNSKPKLDNPDRKKDSYTFSIDDVRSIINDRKKDVKKSTSKNTKKESSHPSKTTKKIPKKKEKAAKVKKLQTASIDDILGFGGSIGSTRPFRDESNVPTQWRSYYNDLMTLRHSLKGALGERSSETLGSSAREASGELSINSSDSGTESFNRDVALSMVATEQEALEEIEDAIDRIFDGTFGICQETQKPIKKTRLKVVPFTRFSLEGQVLYENRKRKDNDIGGGIFATIADSTMGDDN